MVTWWSLGNAAKGEVGITVPSDRITDRNLLHWMSEAQHNLQMESRIVKRQWQKTVVQGTTEYALPLDVKHSAISYVSIVVASGNTGGGELKAISWQEYIRRTAAGYSLPASPVLLSPATSLVGLSGVVYAYNKATNNLHLYPGIAGTITMLYVPELNPYYPDDDGEWSDFGETPAAQMKETGPEEAMYPALGAIKAWTKCRIMQNIDGVLPKLFEMKHNQYMGEYLDIKSKFAKEDTEFNSHDLVPYTAGVF